MAISGEIMGTQKTIHDPQQIEEILSKSKFLRLALSDADIPYIVPKAFGYKENVIYLHSFQKGKKSTSLERTPASCLKT
jgi:nitroimidazol reductase NimA-like FMN-containing flavoprotein (pyridoxamine 5'-phosphate oxidase superfamily)